MKKLIFKKGIYTIKFPFPLNNFSPWQDQVKKGMERVRNEYTLRKNVEYGFNISSERYFEIYIRKLK